MPVQLYIISGAAVSGKTALLDLIKKQGSFKAAISPKYSTRPERIGEFDDIKHVGAINDEEYTFVYPMNNFLYGLKAEEITNLLSQGYNVFVILSDLRVAEEVKRFFGSIAVSLYIYRNLSAKQLKKVLEEREKKQTLVEKKLVPFPKQKQTRLNRLYLMQRQYVENITLFDHVILNTGKTCDMLRQVTNLVEGYEKNIVRKNMKGPVIFLIAAASGSGKQTLMSAMQHLGRRLVTIIKKATARSVEHSSDRDGEEIYHVDNTNLPEFDINYIFQDTPYGIKTVTMWQQLGHGRPQVLITNMQQFSKFREKFGPLVVCVYLHATRTKKQLFEWQAIKHGKEKARMKVKNLQNIHEDYIEHIAEFQHVLLNTLEKEDIWEQMFRLIKFYKV